jgi:hypothetical protein
MTEYQEQAIMEAVTKFSMEGVKPIRTPIGGESTSSEGEDAYLKTHGKGQESFATIKNLQSLVGSLL